MKPFSLILCALLFSALSITARPQSPQKDESSVQASLIQEVQRLRTDVNRLERSLSYTQLSLEQLQLSVEESRLRLLLRQHEEKVAAVSVSRDEYARQQQRIEADLSNEKDDERLTFLRSELQEVNNFRNQQQQEESLLRDAVATLTGQLETVLRKLADLEPQMKKIRPDAKSHLPER